MNDVFALDSFLLIPYDIFGILINGVGFGLDEIHMI